MNWSMLFIAFALAVIMGLAFSALLLQLRPKWSARKRMLVAASWLPAVVILTTLVGLAVVRTSGSGVHEGMRDLAFKTMATLGVAFALLGFVGGLIGAALANRRRRQ
jgi:hypothetical protein